MQDKLRDQRIDELEFRVKTLEKAVIACSQAIAKLEVFHNAGAKRLLDELFAEEEHKQ